MESSDWKCQCAHACGGMDVETLCEADGAVTDYICKPVTVHEACAEVHVHVQCTCTCMHTHVHEQSYHIVHYIRRKEEGKEGRKKRTNTDNLQQTQRLRKKYIYMCTHSQLQQLRKI